LSGASNAILTDAIGISLLCFDVTQAFLVSCPMVTTKHGKMLNCGIFAEDKLQVWLTTFK
jgi:hypothetical protein